jgi:hypothetical protein
VLELLAQITRHEEYIAELEEAKASLESTVAEHEETIEKLQGKVDGLAIVLE